MCIMTVVLTPSKFLLTSLCWICSPQLHYKQPWALSHSCSNSLPCFVLDGSGCWVRCPNVGSHNSTKPKMASEHTQMFPANCDSHQETHHRLTAGWAQRICSSYWCQTSWVRGQKPEEQDSYRRSTPLAFIHSYIHESVCVCVCLRERERDKEIEILIIPQFDWWGRSNISTANIIVFQLIPAT